MISLGILLIASTLNASFAEVPDSDLNSLLSTDYFLLENKEQKAFAKILEKTLKESSIDSLIESDEALLEGKPLSMFQDALAKKMNKAKRVDVLPVDRDEVVLSEVVIVNGNKTQAELFNAANRWVSNENLFRKIGGKENTFMMLGGQRTHPTMAQLEASMRSRSTLDNVRTSPNEKITFTLYQYLQTSGATDAIRTLLLQSNVTLLFKDGKYKFNIEDISYDHYNHYIGSQQRFAMSSKCKVSGKIFEFQNVCESAKGSRMGTLISLRSDFKKFVRNLREGILSNLEDEQDEDW
jgi:hypothetical protein